MVWLHQWGGSCSARRPVLLLSLTHHTPKPIKGRRYGANTRNRIGRARGGSVRTRPALHRHPLRSGHIHSKGIHQGSGYTYPPAQ